MPIINITWYEGPTQEKKKKVATSLTKSIVEIIDTPEYPCKPEVIQIIFNDIKRSNVSRAGIIQG
jgi:phenylpyruvate tautomerase PptA (4-oxalocrotonate tautomerase family)